MGQQILVCVSSLVKWRPHQMGRRGKNTVMREPIRTWYVMQALLRVLVFLEPFGNLKEVSLSETYIAKLISGHV